MFDMDTDEQLLALQGKYDRLTAHRARVIKYVDECPDGDPRLIEARRQLRDLGDRVVKVEREMNDRMDWLERKQNGEVVAVLLGMLPVGFEFKLGWNVNRAYVGTYRKNAEGLWDQVSAPERPLVLNMSADHLGFVVGKDIIHTSIEGSA